MKKGANMRIINSISYCPSLEFRGLGDLYLPDNVTPETRAVLRRMFQLRRQHRAGLFHCRIFPVGAPPDGSAITGFYADSGYLIVFREAGCATATAELAGDFAAPVWKQAKLLAGNGSVSTGATGFRVELPPEGGDAPTAAEEESGEAEGRG